MFFTFNKDFSIRITGEQLIVKDKATCFFILFINYFINTISPQ